jgi:NADPH:quinone reductase-like Zn-dependent oxidoreductase
VNYGDLTARNFANISASNFNMPTFLWFPAKIMFGLNKPKKQILGSEFSGEVEVVGKAVKKFKVGDQVFGYLGQTMGANAEYLCMPENKSVEIKPKNLSHEEAAVIPYGSLTSMSHLRKINILPGQKVLINGASGSIGSAAVQLAKHFGAEVTGVCGSARLEFVQALGADKVIDYTKEDFTRSGETYDLIYDILGKSSFSKCKNSLKQNGRYLLASFKTKQLLQMLATKVSGNKKIICALAMEKPGDLTIIKQLAEEGKIKAIIDKRFPFDKTAEAHRYVEDGYKRGSVVITFIET